MTYEVTLTHVPDGAYTEWYLGTEGREFATREEAEAVVRQFYAAKLAHPENFEDAMEAAIVEWEAYSCPKCGKQHASDAYTDEGEGNEAGRTFHYCSEHCRRTH